MDGGARKRRLDYEGGAAAADSPSAAAADGGEPAAKRAGGLLDGGAAPPTVNPLNGRAYSERYFKLRGTRMGLPVYGFLEQLGEHLREKQVVIVEGETGSGKTTQVSAR